jgi:hypothetical protein
VGQANRGAYNLPALNATTFAAVIAVWDGTLVADQRADATAARLTIEELTHYGVHVAVVSDAHVGEIDRQLAVRPRGPGTVHYCVDRGSEVYGVTSDGPVLIHRRTASPSAAKAAGLTDESDSARWMARWLNVQGVSGRLILSDRRAASRGVMRACSLPNWREPRWFR